MTQPSSKATSGATTGSQSAPPTAGKEISTPPRATRPGEKPPIWGEFFRNLGGILFRPTHTWQRISGAPPTVAHVLWPHAVILITARGVAEFAGALTQESTFVDAATVGLFSATTWFALLWVLAPVVLAIASTRGGGIQFGNAFRFVTYSLTPFWIAGILTVLPYPYVAQVADTIMLPYCFYVLATGVVPLLHVDRDKAAQAVGILTGAFFVGITLIPTLLRMALMALSRH